MFRRFICMPKEKESKSFVFSRAKGAIFCLEGKKMQALCTWFGVQCTHRVRHIGQRSAV